MKRVAAIDNLRLIAIIAVVLIHTTTRNLELVHLNILQLPTEFLFNQIARFAVPLFFMISGFTCEASFSWKRFKIIIPYFGWSLFYYIFVYTNHVESFWRTLLDGSSSYQLYFIPSLLILYVLYPILKRLNKWGFLIILAINLFLLQRTYYKNELPFFYPISISILNIGSFLIGVWAHRYQKKVANKFTLLLVPIIGLLGYIIWNEGQFNYLNSFNFQAFYNQWRVSVFIYSALILIVGLSWLKKIKFWGAGLALNVFFVHTAVIEVLTPYVGNNFWGLFGFTVIISFAIVKLLRFFTLKSLLALKILPANR